MQAPKAYYNVVLTSGISLLSPQNVFGKLATTRTDFERSGPTTFAPTSGSSEDVILERWVKDTVAAVPQVEDPMRVSAEYSLLHALRQEQRLGPAPTVSVIHTDSFAGRLAAFALKPRLERDFSARVELRQIPSLNVEDRVRLRRGLAEFMTIVARALEAGGDPRTTCFASIGGYKVMTTLGYLAGTYLGYPSAYLHEDNQILHEIPYVPIQIDPEVLRARAPLMRRVGRCAETSSLSAEERERVAREPYLFEMDEDMVAVSAFGQFLMQRADLQHLFGTRLLASPEVERMLEDRARRREVFAAVERMLRALEHPTEKRNVGLLRHEANLGVEGASFSVFKSPDRAVRLAYRYDAESDTVRLGWVWMEHDAYEREAPRGVHLTDDPDSVAWRDLSDDFHHRS
jgi:putative CRISPR-associated protein (TIGR02619 family)